MSDETPKTLLGIPVSEIPALPWTYQALGRERYYALAVFGGYLDGREPASYTPDLDPRSFAHGVAWKRISATITLDARLPITQRNQIIADLLEGRSDEALAGLTSAELVSQIKLIVQEAKELTELLNARWGEHKPTARNATALAALQRNKQR